MYGRALSNLSHYRNEYPLILMSLFSNFNVIPHLERLSMKKQLQITHHIKMIAFHAGFTSLRQGGAIVSLYQIFRH